MTWTGQRRNNFLLIHEIKNTERKALIQVMENSQERKDPDELKDFID